MKMQKDAVCSAVRHFKAADFVENSSALRPKPSGKILSLIKIRAVLFSAASARRTIASPMNRPDAGSCKKRESLSVRPITAMQGRFSLI
jgi:hypothetical protein